MKKKSRFLTGLLSAVMALSLFALPAAAAGDNANIVSTIDTSRKGTLTIEKYEGEDVTDDKLLDGVTFKIYKVASIDQTNQNGVIETKITPVQALTSKKSDISIDFDTKYSAISATVDAAVADGSLTPVATKKTGADADIQNATGKVKFVNLEVGIYLVVEADAPAQIVNKSANFLVSIPMVNTERTGWNYEITAQPKNTAVYGGVTLYKCGKTAGSDGDGDALAGAKFILQQQKKSEDGTITWEKVTDYQGLTVNSSTDKPTDGILTTNDAGMINISGMTPGTYRFVEYSAPNGYIADGTTFYEFEINNSGNATVKANASYWVADQGDNTKGYIKVVNEKPELDKKVKTGVDDEGNPTFGKAYDYKMGDTVTWEVETKVPSTIAGLATFKITDEMSETLDFTEKQQSEIQITTEPDAKLVKDTDYTVKVTKAANGGPIWVLDFTQAGKTKLATAETKTITVIFDTTLNSKAVVGNGGNLNDAKLEYSNGVYVDGNEQPNPGTNTINNKAVVYTFALDAVKQDGNTKKPLKGAEFTLYQYEGKETTVTEEILKNKGTEVCKLISNDTGKLVIKGNKTEEYNDKQPKLSKGNYYLVETKAPKDENDKNYNLLKDPVKVELKPDYSITTTTVTDTDKEGNVTITRTVQTNKFDNAGTGNNGSFNVIIYNKKGFDLPTTGGFGTLLFSGIGALLVVGGVGVLMSTKKKKGNA